MTTAHRPTWAPAKGHEEQGGMRIYAPSRMQSKLDVPGQTTLKFRWALRACLRRPGRPCGAVTCRESRRCGYQDWWLRRGLRSSASTHALTSFLLPPLLMHAYPRSCFPGLPAGSPGRTQPTICPQQATCARSWRRRSASTTSKPSRQTLKVRV